ncbi:FANCL C-terminal domain-containing protein [Chytriomyces sp. MP71]|nr:FANCL C-terminal domain-containing protein [Chytriomyces sp. MP71]
MEFELLDAGQRTHVLRVPLSSSSSLPSYSQSPPLALADAHFDAPLPWAQFVVGPRVSLVDLTREFTHRVQRLQPFWNALDNLDLNAFVVDGAASRSLAKRKVALGKSCFLHVELDPAHLDWIPKYRISGPEHLVANLEANLVSNRSQWNPASSVCSNIEALLGLSLPSKNLEDGTADANLDFCGICMSYMNDSGLTPDQSCSNASCLDSFHHVWLKEWLEGNQAQDTRTDYLQGPCPYCSQDISLVDQKVNIRE